MKHSKEKILYALTTETFKKMGFEPSHRGLKRMTVFGLLYIKSLSVNKGEYKIVCEFDQSSRLDHCGVISLLDVRNDGRWVLTYQYKDSVYKNILEDIEKKLSNAITGTNDGIPPEISKCKMESNDSLDMDSDYNKGLNELLKIINQQDK